jgi:hypothetical protein
MDVQGGQQDHRVGCSTLLTRWDCMALAPARVQTKKNHNMHAGGTR